MTISEQRLKYRPKLAKFLARPNADHAATLLKSYLLACVPNPRKGEHSLWSVTCLPSTNSPDWPRLFCVNMSQMETFVVGYYRDDPSDLWAFINVSDQELRSVYGSYEDFVEPYDEITVEQTGYKAGGSDQARIHVTSVEQIDQLLADAGVIAASNALNVRLQESKNSYARYHCFDLVDYALDGTIPDWTETLVTHSSLVETLAADTSPDDDPDAVQIGSIILVDEKGQLPQTFIISSSEKSDLTMGKITQTTPIGAALMGHHVGDVVIVKVPDGKIVLTILEIRQET